MGKLIIAVEVTENGKEVPESLRQAVLESRAELCDILNDKGGAIEKYNELTDMLLFDKSNDDVYMDIYEMLSNQCWTKLLNKKGYPYTVVSEVFHKPTRPFLRTQVDYISKIEVKKQ